MPSIDPNSNEMEKTIRAKLDASGQLSKMRAMIVDASLRALAADPESKGDTFAPNSNFKRLQNQNDGQEMKLMLSVAVECLQYLGLTYSANVVAVESGFKPVEFPRREALMASLGLTDEIADPGMPLLGALLDIGADEEASSAGNSPSNKAPDNKANNNTSAPSSKATTPASSPAKSEQSPVKNTAAPQVTEMTADAVKPVVAAAEPEVFKKPHPLSEDSTYIISRWNNRTFVRQNQVKGQQMNIDYLDNCKMYVLDNLDSTNVDDCNDCEMVFAAAEGSIFLRNCKNCVVYAACKQLRTRDCVNVDLRLFSATDPVVEASTGVTFRPFNLRLPNLIENMTAARLKPAVNRYIHVYDFTADDASIPQPHFTVQHLNHGLVMEERCADYGTPEAPKEIEQLLRFEIDPADSCESGGNKSLNIKSGASAWQKPAEEEEEEKPTPVTTGHPPAATTTSTAPVAAAAGDDSYSSYDDDTVSSGDGSDKYAVDEDSDNF